VLDREINSLTNAILIESLKITKFAMLSRAVAGQRKSTLIINLPGSKKGAQVLLFIFLDIEHIQNYFNFCKSKLFLYLSTKGKS
jgi:molybdopterin biosynthesis enzyme MoaB